LKLIGYLGKQGNGKEDREEYSETGHGLVIAKVQRGQKVEETLNKFKGITSPLSLRRDSFITLDLKEFFGILTLNFAFFPRKLMVSHIQGFRVSSLL
jgi:hypothetical protein